MYNFSSITQQQKAALQAIAEQYKDVAGSYESTMLGGIVHGYCDSGILTDSYSAECAELVNKYFTEEAQNYGYLSVFNDFITAVEGKGLLCCKVIAEIEAVVEDAELGAAYIGWLMGWISGEG